MNQALLALQAMGFYKADEVRPPATMLSIADGARWEMPDGSLAEKQIRMYTLMTWIATAIDHTASIAADAMFSVKRVADEPGGGDDEDIPNHEFEKLLRKPNPSQSRGEFMRDAFTMYRATGNLYLYKNTPDEKTPPVELWMVPTPMIKPIPDGRSYIRGYEFTAPGKTAQFIPAWQIMHLKTSNPHNSFVGLSPVQSLVLDAWADLAQQKWNLAFFDKNNAKLPTILAFNNMIADPEWAKIKAERDNEWGGANRSGVMLLRGVGDTMQLLQATATQEQMEFLEARAFTRSEVYGKLAPGLDNILAINATEANAKVGWNTLIRLGVWPVLVQIAEKFTADLLTLYKDGADGNLVGAFDDIRPLEVAEEEKFFTINEIRQRRYKAGPLYLDESQAARLEEETSIAGEGQDMAFEERDRQIAAQKFVAPQPDKPKPDAATPKAGKQLDPRGFLFVAQVGPATPLPGDTSKPAAPAMPPMPPPAKPAGGSPFPPKKAVDDELEAWEKFELKHSGKGREFEVRAVPWLQAARIKAALKAGDDVRDVFTRERMGEGGDVARLAAAIEAVEKKL